MAVRQGAEHDFNVSQGADWIYSITVKDSNNIVVDLTDWDCWMVIDCIKSYNQNISYELTKANNGISINEVNGIITFTIPSTDTAKFDFCETDYNIYLQDSNSNTDIILYGKMTLTRTE